MAAANPGARSACMQMMVLVGVARGGFPRNTVLYRRVERCSEKK